MVPRPAATVMLLRPANPGIDVYMTRRSSRSRFMPDAYVFPGGAVDAADGEPPGAYAVAGLRELFEEAGVLLACDATGTPAALDAPSLETLRAAATSGASLGALLAERGLRLDVERTLYYSNWITPESEPIRFDARFFVALAPEDQIAAADAIEVHDGMWVSASDALARADRNELTVRFPTRKHLERLARFADIDAFLVHARSRSVVAVMPYDDGTEAYGIPGGNDAW
jgi:8-oxo-dGTP pyrophosphatase MutT (NUDIX family)